MELMACADLVGGTTEQSCIFSWSYMIVSMIWNTSELSELHLSGATAIFVVDYCQFGPSWIFGLKMELTACADLVGGTTDQSCNFFWTYIILSMIWNTSELFPSQLSLDTAIFVVDCCQFGPNWMFGLKMELSAFADLVGGTTECSYHFPWSYKIVSMIRNTSELYALHLSLATAISDFVAKT